MWRRQHKRRVRERRWQQNARKQSIRLDGRLFQPISVESLVPFTDSATSFFNDLGQRIAAVSVDISGSFLFQRLSWLSVLIQRFNAVFLHDSFVDDVSGSCIPAKMLKQFLCL